MIFVTCLRSVGHTENLAREQTLRRHESADYRQSVAREYYKAGGNFARGLRWYDIHRQADLSGYFRNQNWADQALLERRMEQDRRERNRRYSERLEEALRAWNEEARKAEEEGRKPYGDILDSAGQGWRKTGVKKQALEDGGYEMGTASIRRAGVGLLTASSRMERIEEGLPGISEELNAPWLDPRQRREILSQAQRTTDDLGLKKAREEFIKNASENLENLLSHYKRVKKEYDKSWLSSVLSSIANALSALAALIPGGQAAAVSFWAASAGTGLAASAVSGDPWTGIVSVGGPVAGWGVGLSPAPWTASPGGLSLNSLPSGLVSAQRVAKLSQAGISLGASASRNENLLAAAGAIDAGLSTYQGIGTALHPGRAGIFQRSRGALASAATLLDGNAAKILQASSEGMGAVSGLWKTAAAPKEYLPPAVKVGMMTASVAGAAARAGGAFAKNQGLRAALAAGGGFFPSDPTQGRIAQNLRISAGHRMADSYFPYDPRMLSHPAYRNLVEDLKTLSRGLAEAGVPPGEIHRAIQASLRGFWESAGGKRSPFRR